LRLTGWKNTLTADEGAEIAEVAMILPLVLLFLFGILWFGRAYNIYTTVTYAAREGAKVAALGVNPGCATCSPTAPAASDVASRVAEVLQAAHMDSTQVATYAPNPVPSVGCTGGITTATANNVTVYSNVQLNAATTTGPPACGVVVSFQYPFNFALLNPGPPFGKNAFTLNLKAAAQMQVEN